MLGHIVVLPGVPAFVAWIVAGLEIGVFTVLVLGKRRQRRLAMAAGGLALAGLLAAGLVVKTAPPAPSLTLQILDPPARTTSPVPVVICSSDPSQLFAAGRVLALTLDGHQVLTLTNQPEATLLVSPGPHTLGAELLSSDHQSFDPRVQTQRQFTVVGFASQPPLVACPA